MVANILLKCKHPLKFYKGKAKNKRATILEATKLKVQWKVVARNKQENKVCVTFTMQ